MLPTKNSPWPAASRRRRESEELSAVNPAEDTAVSRPKQGPTDPLRPIGPERLRALREAIRNGTYPTEADVVGGLQRMFRWDD